MQDAISLVIVALSRRREVLIQLTLVSHRPFEAVLQEALAMGRRFLESKVGAVRVEIYDEQAFLSSQGKPLASLTRDDLITKTQTEGKNHWLMQFTHSLKRLLWGRSFPYTAS